MDDLETRLRAAYRARAANAPRELHRELPEEPERSPNTIRQAVSTWRGPVIAAAAVAAVVAAVVVLVPLVSDSDDTREPGWSGTGITLNTSSWEPGDDEDEMGIRAVVRIDPNGCVYLGSPRSSELVRNVIWPAGYTASRQANGTVNILNPDGVVVAATGQRLNAGGGEAPSDTELACRAQGTNFGTVTITDELSPAID